MKKIILLMLIAMPLAQAVKGQSYYSETYWKHSDKLIRKNWTSGGNHRTDVYDNGEIKTTISLKDSASHYVLAPATKKILAMPKSESTPEAFGGLVGVDERNVKKELLGTEEVEGYMCKKYKITIANTTVDGRTRTKEPYYEWWTEEPFLIRIQYQEGSFGEPQVTRNIQIGPQPAHLFELPKDYEIVSMSSITDGINEKVDKMKDAMKMLQDMKK